MLLMFDTLRRMSTLYSDKLSDDEKKRQAEQKEMEAATGAASKADAKAEPGLLRGLALESISKPSIEMQDKTPTAFGKRDAGVERAPVEYGKIGTGVQGVRNTLSQDAAIDMLTGMAGRGVRSGAATALMGTLMGAPAGLIGEASIGALASGALGPGSFVKSLIDLAVSSSSASSIADEIAEEGWLAEDTPLDTPVARAAINTGRAAARSSPKSAMDAIGALLGFGPSATEAGRAGAEALSAGLRGGWGLTETSGDPIAKGLYSGEPEAMSSVIGSMLDADKADKSGNGGGKGGSGGATSGRK